MWLKSCLPLSNVNAENEYGHTALQCVLNKFYNSETIPENYQRIIELLKQHATPEGKRPKLDRLLDNITEGYHLSDVPFYIITAVVVGLMTIG